MKRELFKELNAHIRACDNKSMTLNAGYLAALLFLNTDRAKDNLIKGSFDLFFVDQKYYDILLIIIIIVIGYSVLFVQLWFRAWKRHYLDICHQLWLSHRNEFGDNVPIWMRKNASFMSYDNIIRLGPFFVNAILLIRLSSLLIENSNTQWYIMGLLVIIHIVISILFLRIGNRVGQYSA